MDKLKDMISSVIGTNDKVNVSSIKKNLNKKYPGNNISTKQIDDFLQSEYEDEEVKFLEQRYRGFDGKFYI